MQEPDKLTETRGSIEVEHSIMNKIYRCFCPCLSFQSSNDRKIQVYFDSEESNRVQSIKAIKQQFEMPRTSHFAYNFSFNLPTQNERNLQVQQNQIGGQVKKMKSKTFLVSSSKDRKNDYLMKEQTNNEKTRKKEWYNYPIQKFQQKNLMMLGKGNRQLLVQISTTFLEPSPSSVKKQYSSKANKNMQTYHNPILDAFWNKRYFLFEKFDQGIQIDQGSLSRIPPEIVSDYIAGKCDQCKTAIDAFSGIGNNALKLGSVCQKVICVQQDCKKYKYLINNAKVYQVENVELFLKPFVQIEMKSSVDVVLVHPYLKNQEVLGSSVSNIDDFQPALDKVIKKSLQIGQNLILLLPSNVNIRQICECISEACHNLNKTFSTCSAKIQKVCFRSSVSHIILFFGPNVQKTIKLNDQLGYMYKILKNKHQKYFQHKKLLKKLRETYGMMKLLNFVYESKKASGKSQIQKLYTYIRQNKLLTQAKLQKIISEQQKQKQRKKNSRAQSLNRVMNDETTNRSSINEKDEMHQSSEIEYHHNVNQDGPNIQDKTQSDRTQSYYSNYSGFSNLKKAYTSSYAESSKKTSDKGDRTSNTSSIVVRITQGGSLQKQSKSPASPNLKAHDTKPVRGSLKLDIKQIQKQMKATKKEKLQRTLISKIDQQI